MLLLIRTLHYLYYLVNLLLVHYLVFLLLLWQVVVIRVMDLDDSESSSDEDADDVVMELPPPRPSACAKVVLTYKLKYVLHIINYIHCCIAQLGGHFVLGLLK